MKGSGAEDNFLLTGGWRLGERVFGIAIGGNYYCDQLALYRQQVFMA